MMWLKKAGVLLMCACVFVPSLALAHATPTSYTPASGATELDTPVSISIRFTERIEMGASSLTVYGPDGQEVNQGKGAFEASDKRSLSVPITDAGEGVYTVSWQVVSVDDGHFTKGAYSFLVDSEGKVFEGDAGGSVEIDYSSKLPEAALDFLKLFGESVFLASLIFLFFICRPLQRKNHKEQTRARSLYVPIFTYLISIGFILFLLGSAVIIVQKTLELSALQGTLFRDALLVYLQSSVGTFYALKIVAACGFYALWMKYRHKLFAFSAPKVFAILCVLLGAILYMQSYISHAAASLFYPNVSIAVTFVHLAAKEFIIGGLCLLLPLFILLLRTKKVSVYERIALRFDVLSAFALIFAAISGAYISWLHLKHAQNLFATQWGELFMVLLLCTLTLGAFRVFHQMVVHPRIQESTRMQKLFLATLPVEALLGLLVLFYSGYISITTPPFIVEQYAYTQQEQSQGVSIAFGVHPHEHDSFKIELTDAETHEPLKANALTVTASNPEKNIGPNVLTTSKRALGTYVFPAFDLSPHGQWNVAVNVAQKTGYDARATFSLDYPADVEASKWSDKERTFDQLAVVMLSVAAAFSLVCALLIYISLTCMRKHTVQQETAMLTNRTVFMHTGLYALCLAGLVCLLLFAVWNSAGVSAFEKLCKADGHQWRQAFPTRAFDATSPNALNGCTIHDGHYHIVDEAEYRYLRENMQ